MDNNQNKEPTLDALTATRMLEDIFEESELEPNSLPLEALDTQTAYAKRRLSPQRVILIIVMALWLLLPLMFITPKYDVTLTEPQGGDPPVYTIEVTSKLPVRQAEAVMDGKELSVYAKEDGKIFAVEPEKNGTMEIRITAVNRQTTVKTVEVTAVDEAGPKLISSDMDDTSVYLRMEDEGSGVDFENVYGITASGEVFFPEETDSVRGLITFGIPSEKCDIYVPDLRGNALHLTMGPGKEN